MIIVLTLRSLDHFPSLDQMIIFMNDKKTQRAVLVFSAFFLIALVFRSLRFYLLLRNITHTHVFDIVTVFLWTFLLGAISPMRIGEGARLVWAKEREINRQDVFVAWLIERGADLFFLLCLLGIGFVVTRVGLNPWPSFLIAIAIPMILLWFSHNLLQYISNHRFEEYKIPYFKGTVDISRFKSLFSTKVFAPLSILTPLIWSMMIFAFWNGYGVFIPGLDLSAAILLVSAINLSFLFALLPGNAVGYQLAAVATLGFFAIDPDVSLASSIILHTTTLALIIIVGVIARIARYATGYRSLF